MGTLKRACSDELVYPRPIMRTNGDTKWEDFRTNAPCLDSIQILKPHGSLNWYTYGEDNGGSLSIIRARELRSFREDSHSNTDDEMITELAETRGMNRYLVPPTSNKASFYNIGLDRVIWNQCFTALQQTHDVTIMGYSAPKTDDVVYALLGETFNNYALHIVDCSAEKVKENIDDKVFMSDDIECTLEKDIPRYTEERLQTRAKAFAENLNSAMSDINDDVTLYAMLDYPYSKHSDVIDKIAFLIDVDDEGHLMTGSARQQVGEDEDQRDIANKVRATRKDLQKILSDGLTIEVTQEANRSFVAIGAERCEGENMLVLRCVQK